MTMIKAKENIKILIEVSNFYIQKQTEMRLPLNLQTK